MSKSEKDPLLVEKRCCFHSQQSPEIQLENRSFHSKVLQQRERPLILQRLLRSVVAVVSFSPYRHRIEDHCYHSVLNSLATMIDCKTLLWKPRHYSMNVVRVELLNELNLHWFDCLRASTEESTVQLWLMDVFSLVEDHFHSKVFPLVKNIFLNLRSFPNSVVVDGVRRAE